jgi:RHS repeat-associated protein
MNTASRFNLAARFAFPFLRLIALLIAALLFVVIPMSGQSSRMAKQSPTAISGAKPAPTDTISDPAIESDADFVAYTHAVGVSSIDEPIAIYKSDIAIFPHTGWRGMLAMGTYANGAQSDCPVVNPCERIDWPGSDVTIDRRGYGRDEPTAWYGSLASGVSEGSGLQYMRNRYYDPTRGQFTQADPIGVGGGLNLYGFAGGDPVNYNDPFGLYPCCSLVGLPHSGLYVEIGEAAKQAALDFMIGVGSGGVAGTERQSAQLVGKSLSRIGTKIQNLLSHLTPQDFRGAARDLRGLQSGGQHLKEVTEAAAGLRKQVQSLKNVLGNPNISEGDRTAITDLLRKASSKLDEANRVIRKP